MNVSNSGLVKHAVYVDSPVLLALNQIEPFFASGVFSASKTPVFLKRHAILQMQSMLHKFPANIDVRLIPRKAASSLPIEKGGVQFYPFNSQSNLNAITNRNVSHVLTLHGESNKVASYRPAARMFDYVTIAGPLARDRYLKAQIFTKHDVDHGRLIMTGDSFVQGLPWLQLATPGSQDASVLYCPTWEGYGAQTENYTSVIGLYGFKAAATAARLSAVDLIYVKPHPYLGFLSVKALKAFVCGLRYLERKGFRVRVLSRDANVLVRTICRSLPGKVELCREGPDLTVRVAVGICDVSGMEAILLKQGIPHMSIAHTHQIPKQIHDLYHRKALVWENDCETKMTEYLNSSDKIDALHYQQVFGWQDSSLASAPPEDFQSWIHQYIQQNPFWAPSGKGV